MPFQVQTPVRNNWIVKAGALSTAIVSLALYWAIGPGIASAVVAGLGFMAVATRDFTTYKGVGRRAGCRV